jgi:serine/threonine protein phosphatase 1
MMAANIYNLDTGAGQGGKLTIMDLTTKKFYQSDPITTHPSSSTVAVSKFM